MRTYIVAAKGTVEAVVNCPPIKSRNRHATKFTRLRFWGTGLSSFFESCSGKNATWISGAGILRVSVL